MLRLQGLSRVALAAVIAWYLVLLSSFPWAAGLRDASPGAGSPLAFAPALAGVWLVLSMAGFGRRALRAASRRGGLDGVGLSDLLARQVLCLARLSAVLPIAAFLREARQPAAALALSVLVVAVIHAIVRRQLRPHMNPALDGWTPAHWVPVAGAAACLLLLAAEWGDLSTAVGSGRDVFLNRFNGAPLPAPAAQPAYTGPLARAIRDASPGELLLGLAVLATTLYLVFRDAPRRLRHVLRDVRAALVYARGRWITRTRNTWEPVAAPLE